MASRTALFSLFFFSTAASALAGCDTPGDDYPEGEQTIHVGVTRLGVPTQVSVSQQTDEWELCHPRVGELGPWIDCHETRQRDAKLVSIACVPAGSCRDVKTEGAKGSFFALAERFSVKVVAEIEGSRVETTRSVEAEKPDVRVSISPEHAIEGAAIEVCRGPEGPATTLAVSLDGAPLAPSSIRAHRDGCVVFVPPVPGRLTASVRLVDPPTDLDPATGTVHARSELRDVGVTDLQCDRRDGPVGAYAAKDGTYLVRVSAHGRIDDGSCSLPASAIRLRDGDLLLRSTGIPEAPFAQFVLERAPSPDARIEVDLGDRTETVPVVVRRCG